MRPLFCSLASDITLHERRRDLYAYAFSYHDGQSNGGGPSLLVLVAILPHIVTAEVHIG